MGRSVELSKWTVLIGRTGFDTVHPIPDPTLRLSNNGTVDVAHPALMSNWCGVAQLVFLYTHTCVAVTTTGQGRADITRHVIRCHLAREPQVNTWKSATIPHKLQPVQHTPCKDRRQAALCGVVMIYELDEVAGNNCQGPPPSSRTLGSS